MNPDRKLRDASERIRSELGQLDIPPPPTPLKPARRVASFAMGMAVVLAVLGITGLAIRMMGDGSDVVIDSTSTTSTLDGGTDRVYRGTVTVIDTGDNAVVCAGGVAESYPPQCGGPRLVGLEWSSIPWAESANGVSWATMTIEIELDGDSLVLVGMPTEPEPSPGDEIDFTPPCEPPPGGWVWVDGPLTTPQDMDAAIAYANQQPDLSAIWVYNLLENPEEADLTGRQEYVVVARFNGNLEKHEAAMRALWLGPLCVSLGEANSADLRDVQTELTDRALAGEIPGLVGFGFSHVDEMRGEVVLGALIADDHSDAWIAENYAGVPVRLESQLKPAG